MAKTVEIREIANGFIIRTTIETVDANGATDFDTTEVFSKTNPMEKRGPIIAPKEPIIGPLATPRMAAIVNG